MGAWMRGADDAKCDSGGWRWWWETMGYRTLGFKVEVMFEVTVEATVKVKVMVKDLSLELIV